MDSYYRRSQKHEHFRRKRKLYLWTIAILIVLVYSSYALLRPLSPITLAASQASEAVKDESAPLPWPAGAESAIGSMSDGVLATSSANEKPLPTASIAKLITALTVLRDFPLKPDQQGPDLTLGPADVNLYNEYYKEGGSLVEVKAGEQINEHQALEAMLLPSGNNMADSLAIWAFGSLKQYRAAAENEIAALGMTHTTIGPDASGFNPSTTSTPGDLIKLGQAVLADPLLKQIVSEKTANVPVAGEVHNTNYLLGTSNIIGIKTGNSSEAGGCLLFAANYQPTKTSQVTIIGAIQHAPDLLAAMKAATPLLNAAGANFKPVTIIASGQTVTNFTAPWLAAPVPVVAQNSLTLPLWPGEIPKRSITSKQYNSPHIFTNSFSSIAAGSVVGNLSVGSYNDARSTPLVLNERISPPGVFWRLTHPI